MLVDGIALLGVDGAGELVRQFIWLGPLADQVQDSKYINALALSIGESAEQLADNRPFTTAARASLYRWLDVAKLGDSQPIGPFGPTEVTDVDDYPVRTQFARSWRLQTSIGQGLIITRYDKGRNGAARWRQASSVDTRSLAIASDAPPSHRDRSRSGLVLTVSDMTRSRRFYERVLGLTVLRSTARYISFGWLALEGSSDTGQLQLSDAAPTALGSIRIYVEEQELHALQGDLEAWNLPYTDEVNGRRLGLRTTDPDGNPIEIWTIPTPPGSHSDEVAPD